MTLTLLALVTLAGVAAACKTATPSLAPRDPSVVGVIDGVQFLGSRSASVSLRAGTVVEIDFAAAKSLYGAGPTVGDLLLYGSDAAGPWYVELQPAGDAFLIIQRQLVGIDPQHTMAFDFGLRLPVASTYREPGYGQGEAGMSVFYFVNEKGEVVGRQ